jgi:hypothetical protein
VDEAAGLKALQKGRHGPLRDLKGEGQPGRRVGAPPGGQVIEEAEAGHGQPFRENPFHLRADKLIDDGDFKEEVEGDGMP